MSTTCFSKGIYELDKFREAYAQERGSLVNISDFADFLHQKTGVAPMYSAHGRRVTWMFTWCFDNDADALQFKLAHLTA